MKTTGTITMTMRELDRLKVIEAVTDFGPTLACEKLLECHGIATALDR